MKNASVKFMVVKHLVNLNHSPSEKFFLLHAENWAKEICLCWVRNDRTFLIKCFTLFN